MTRLPADIEPLEQPVFDAGLGLRCVPPDLLLPAMEGTLPEPLLGRARRHIDLCVGCRDLIVELGRDRAVALRARESVRIDHRVLSPSDTGLRRRRSWRAWGAMAALLAIAVGGGWLVPADWIPTDRPFVNRPGADHLLPRTEFVLTVNAPVIALPPEALVLRGGARDPYVGALEIGLKPFRRGNYAAAAIALARVSAAYHDRPHAYFYRGVSLLLAGQPGQAVEPLAQARALTAGDRVLADEAAWYLAASFERSGRISGAVTTLGDLCAGSGPHHLDACRALPGFSPLSSNRRRGPRASGRRDRVDRVVADGSAVSGRVRSTA